MTAAAVVKRIQGWRCRIADALARNAPALPLADLDAAAQGTLEQLVFSRACAAYGLEQREQNVDPALLTDAPDLLDDLADALNCDPTVPPWADLLVQMHECFASAALTRAADGHLTAGARRASQKSGGVYYTPLPLVNHVVQHTLASSSRDGASPPRVLDPACGAGAFLLGVFRSLCHRPVAERLSLPDRLAVLTGCIFGVDLDPRAVETARRALLLALCEGRHPDEVSHFFRNHPLPDLTANIRRGDALVGPDFRSGDAAGDDVLAGISPLDWPSTFPAILQSDNPSAGFDVVLGNPPWGQKEICRQPRRIEYLRSRFPSARGIFDLFRPFVELAVRLCRPGGTVGLVLPDIVLLKNYEPTRRFLLDHLTLTALDWWGMRFPGAVIDAATVIGTKAAAPPNHCVSVCIHAAATTRSHTIPQSDFHANERCAFNLFLTPEKRGVLHRLSSFPKLGQFFEIHEGVHSGNLRSELFVERAVDDTCRPLLFGRDELAPYHLNWRGKYLRRSAAPARRSPARYANLGHADWFEREKLLVRRTGDRLLAAVDRDRRYASNNFFVVFARQPHALDLDGLCAVLNSGVMTWIFRTIEPRQGRVFAELKIKHLVALPLPDPERNRQGCADLNRLGRHRAAIAAQLAETPDGSTFPALRDDAAELDRSIEAVVRQVLDVPTLPD